MKNEVGLICERRLFCLSVVYNFSVSQHEPHKIFFRGTQKYKIHQHYN